MLQNGQFVDPSGAFDKMISAKKEAKDVSARKKPQFKLSKEQEV